MGPLLFTIYIDDVVNQISPSSSISLYADDITLYRCIKSPADYLILQTDIINITIQVEEKLYLKFNHCSTLFISRKLILTNTPPKLFIKVDCEIRQVSSVKYLGVVLTSDLSWTEHISKICCKTRKLIGLFYRCFNHCEASLLIMTIQVIYMSRPRVCPPCVGSLSCKRNTATEKKLKDMH